MEDAWSSNLSRTLLNGGSNHDAIPTLPPQEEEEPFPLGDLPEDAIQRICSKLPVTDIARLSQASKTFRQVTESTNPVVDSPAIVASHIELRLSLVSTL